MINYSSDKPIDNAKEDLLGRSLFSEQLGKAIYDHNSKDSLVIGLFGKWGTGKTSIINMAMNTVKSLSSNDESEPLIIRFSPWNYSDKNNLISLFFQNLKNSINSKENKKLKEQIGDALNAYSDVCDAISFIPVPGSNIFASLTKNFIKSYSAKLKKSAELETSKGELEKALIKSNKKIIVIIDDIDRLTNSQIRDVFQLVKQVADFSNIIYILAMDREIVCNALSDVHNIDGSEYLEKIIQVPFEIPELRKEKLHRIFLNKLEQIINELPNKELLDREYWNETFNNCIEPYINTLRDVNRVINTFQFKYEKIYQETSFEDVISLTVLEVLQPNLYKWISSNKDAVCGGFMHGYLSDNRDKNNYKKSCYEEFEKLGTEPEKAIKCISTMFPVFARDIDNYRYGHRSESSVRSSMRVANAERFGVYFMFDLDDIKVSRNVINDCIYNLDVFSLKSIVYEIIAQGNINYFLDELRSLIDKIPHERLGMIATALLEVQSRINNDSVGFLEISARDKAEYTAFDFIKKLNSEEERYSIIFSALNNADKHKIGSIARIIISVENSYGRLSSSEKKSENQIISISLLNELEKAFVSKSLEIITTESISNIDGFYYIFYLLEHLDKDKASKYIEEMFKNDVNKLKFVCSLASKWNGTGGSGWSFYQENYSKYISKEEIYMLISNYDKKNLDVFSEIEQIKLASFVLNYNNKDMEHVAEDKARELLTEWKAEK